MLHKDNFTFSYFDTQSFTASTLGWSSGDKRKKGRSVLKWVYKKKRPKKSWVHHSKKKSSCDSHCFFYCLTFRLSALSLTKPTGETLGNTFATLTTPTRTPVLLTMAVLRISYRLKIQPLQEAREGNNIECLHTRVHAPHLNVWAFKPTINWYVYSSTADHSILAVWVFQWIYCWV